MHVCMRACVCLHACVYARVCVCMHVCACVCVCLHACVYARVCVCACISTCVRVCTCSSLQSNSPGLCPPPPLAGHTGSHRCSTAPPSLQTARLPRCSAHHLPADDRCCAPHACSHTGEPGTRSADPFLFLFFVPPFLPPQNYLYSICVQLTPESCA